MTTSPPQEAVTYPAAELDRRFYALVIDRLIAWALFGGASYAAWRFLIDEDQLWAGIGAIVGTVVLVSVVFALMLGLAGVTPGKKLVGLRVVRDADGKPIGFPRALLRTAVLGIFTLPTLGLGLATLAWTAVMDPTGRRRGGHDRMADAVVVDVRPAPEPIGDDDARSRQIVNLTAMRLLPSPPPESVVAPRPPGPPSGPPQGAPPGPPQGLPQGRPPQAPPQAPPPGMPPAAPPRTPSHRAGPPPVASPETPGEDVISGPTQRRTPAGAQQAATSPQQTPQSARWRVSFDTGESFVVQGLTLVGRRPEPRQGEDVAHLVPLRSSDMSVSKTHAQFQVVPDGALVVMDRGSTNGSVVVRKGVSKSLSPGRPSTLLDGDSVRFGDRTMTVTHETTA
ncbi:hypothetical protein GCM10023340_40350 [Nocardioides marinquilinus]|uniref:FHA domain-containing protein n=1 Tax=Nocardioides marinquilinus TaxID=1210400 RepID=A0ABP9Q4T2_9ACTN